MEEHLDGQHPEAKPVSCSDKWMRVRALGQVPFTPLTDMVRRFADLIFARHHPADARRERAEFIKDRVRLIAVILSGLTLAWIPIDAHMIRWPYWGEIMAGRVVLSLVFLVLAMRPTRWWRFNAAIEVTMLAAAPLAFFLYTNDVLSISGWFGGPGGMLAVNTAYFYLPFIVAAGLSIFPLTALEAALPAGLTIGVMTLAVEVWPQFLGGQSDIATVWRIILIAGIAVLAGLSQLRFLLRLTAEAMRDSLTGLLTRRIGKELLDHQFAYARRQDLPFALLFLDLDHFKQVNDRFGHKAGDQVLSAVGRILSQACRRQDVVIRWGGEEFVVGLPGTDATAAELIVKRLAEFGLGRRPDNMPVTASIGLAERQIDGIDSLRTLIELADQRMYEAKKAGRNGYCLHGKPRRWIENMQTAAQAVNDWPLILLPKRDARLTRVAPTEH
jgi:diguanylate cyclase (GGDEF)-like protein